MLIFQLKIFIFANKSVQRMTLISFSYLTMQIFILITQIYVYFKYGINLYLSVFFLQVPIFVPVIVFLFSLTIVIVPFTAGVPRKEFLFSVVVAALSIIGFLPFGKAKRFMKYLGNFLLLFTELKHDTLVSFFFIYFFQNSIS